MPDHSEITISRGGTVYAGPDATELFACMVLRSAIKLLSKGIKPTRGMSMRRALAMCERYTGQTYKRTEWEEAVEDLGNWIETMKSALPITVKED